MKALGRKPPIHICDNVKCDTDEFMICPKELQSYTDQILFYKSALIQAANLLDADAKNFVEHDSQALFNKRLARKLRISGGLK